MSLIKYRTTVVLSDTEALKSDILISITYKRPTIFEAYRTGTSYYFKLLIFKFNFTDDQTYVACHVAEILTYRVLK